MDSDHCQHKSIRTSSSISPDTSQIEVILPYQLPCKFINQCSNKKDTPGLPRVSEWEHYSLNF